MKSSLIRVLVILVVALLTLVPSVRASWVLDGVVVEDPSMLDPGDPQLVPVPGGGAIMVYVAHASGFHDIHAQRYDAWGNPLWGAGVPVAVAANEQYAPVAVGDGAGGVIVAWTDFRSGTAEGVYAQRLDADGVAQWAANGVVLASAAGSAPRMVSDQTGGAVVSWRDSRGVDNDIYAQRLDPAGNALWTPGGFGVCTTSGDQQDFVMVDNGVGGAYFAWSINTGSALDILGQNVNGGGWLEWHTYPQGRTICGASGNQWSTAVAPDGHGRLLVAWLDDRAAASHVYAQLVNDHGGAAWAADGVAAYTGPGGTYDPAIVGDGAGGAILVWDQGDVFGQRLDASGNQLWASTGEPVCTAPGSQNAPAMVADGAGGAVVAWEDNRHGNYDVFAQRLDPSGAALWPVDGTPACTALGDQRLPALAGDGEGGCYLAWRDERYGFATDIRAQRVERNGFWGYPCPVIARVDDIPGDQGWQVNVSWAASRLDAWPDEAVETYSLWRALDDGGAKSLPADALLLDLVDFEPGLKGRVLRLDAVPAKTLYWEYLGEVPARHLPSYAQPLPTLFNLTPESAGYHAFQVVAHAPTMAGAGYWISEPDTGRSIDNLAPVMPAMLAGEQVYDPLRLEISWEPNVEADLSHYAVHRGTAPGFLPGPTNLVATVTTPLIHDDLWQMGSGYYYKVAARDMHGNESPFALLDPSSISSVEGAEVPDATAVTGVHPNPFNPRVRIRFTVRDPQRITVSVYDLTGRRLTVLTDEVWHTGTHDVAWEGRDNAGREMASGVYLVDFRARGASSTEKVMLVR